MQAEHNHHNFSFPCLVNNNCSEIVLVQTVVDKVRRPNCLMRFCVLFCGQVGYIQIGSEQMLIQPVNTSETSFSGKEHFIRRRRSTKSSHPVKSRIPDEHCKVVAGEHEVAQENSHEYAIMFLTVVLPYMSVFCNSSVQAAGASEKWYELMNPVATAGRRSHITNVKVVRTYAVAFSW